MGLILCEFRIFAGKVLKILLRFPIFHAAFIITKKTIYDVHSGLPSSKTYLNTNGNVYDVQGLQRDKKVQMDSFLLSKPGIFVI